MRKSLAVAILFAALAVSVQSQTIVTVSDLGAGVYSVSSPAGTQLVNVVPLGSNSYSLMSSDGASTVTALSSGIYTLTTSSGANLGATYVYSLGNGRYSFSNPNTGTSGTVQSMPTVAPIPLPALAVQQSPNNTSLLLLAMMVKQQCDARGGIMYREHWYSKWQCVTSDYVYRRGTERGAAKQAKKR